MKYIAIVVSFSFLYCFVSEAMEFRSSKKMIQRAEEMRTELDNRIKNISKSSIVEIEKRDFYGTERDALIALGKNLIVDTIIINIPSKNINTPHQKLIQKNIEFLINSSLKNKPYLRNLTIVGRFDVSKFFGNGYADWYEHIVDVDYPKAHIFDLFLQLEVFKINGTIHDSYDEREKFFLKFFPKIKKFIYNAELFSVDEKEEYENAKKFAEQAKKIAAKKNRHHNANTAGDWQTINPEEFAKIWQQRLHKASLSAEKIVIDENAYAFLKPMREVLHKMRQELLLYLRAIVEKDKITSFMKNSFQNHEKIKIAFRKEDIPQYYINTVANRVFNNEISELSLAVQYVRKECSSKKIKIYRNEDENLSTVEGTLKISDGQPFLRVSMKSVLDMICYEDQFNSIINIHTRKFSEYKNADKTLKPLYFLWLIQVGIELNKLNNESAVNVIKEMLEFVYEYTGEIDFKKPEISIAFPDPFSKDHVDIKDIYMSIEQHKEACGWYDRDISIPALIVPSLEYLKDISYFSPENIAEKIKGLTPQSPGLNTLPEAIISCRNGKIKNISCNKECVVEIIKLCTKSDAAEFIKVLDPSIFKKVLFDRRILEVYDFLVLILDKEKIYKEYTNLSKANINIGTIDVAYRKSVLDEFLGKNNAIQLQKIINLLPFTLRESDVVVRISPRLRDEFIEKMLGEDLLAFQQSVETLENAVLGEIYRNGFGSAYLTALKDRLNNY